SKPQVLSPTLPNLSRYSATLRRNVRKTNASEYLPVRTPWKNPTIVIQLETTSIILADGTPQKETSLFNLAKDLATLPKSVWQSSDSLTLGKGLSDYSSSEYPYAEYSS